MKTELRFLMRVFCEIHLTPLEEVRKIMSSPVAQTVKRLPKMWDTWVQSLGREDPPEKELATDSNILV